MVRSRYVNSALGIKRALAELKRKKLAQNDTKLQQPIPVRTGTERQQSRPVRTGTERQQSRPDRTGTERRQTRSDQDRIEVEQPRSDRDGIEVEQPISDRAVNEEEPPISVRNEHGTKKKAPRGPTANHKLVKYKEKGKPLSALDIQFPQEFGKVCGHDAHLLKAEITLCIRQMAPLQVEAWTDIPEGILKDMWEFVQTRLGLKHEVRRYVMKQMRVQYRCFLYNLHRRFKLKKGRPLTIGREDWIWLIEHKWTTDKFKNKSPKNAKNRTHQEMPSVAGTRSIIQNAYEMRDPVTGAWPSASKVWQNSRQKRDGTWVVENGQSIFEDLETVGEAYSEEIQSAPIPLVQHFDYVLRTKSGHTRGVGLNTKKSAVLERKQLEAERDAAEKRAETLEDEIKQLRAELESQKSEMETKCESLMKDMQDRFENQMAASLARFTKDYGHSRHSSPST